MAFREVLSGVAIALTFVAFLPYIRAILRGVVHPHVFSWVTWTATTSVVFCAQLADGGGVGAWPLAVSGAITALIALLAYGKRGDISITTLDWLFLLAAAASLPLWYLTADPLWTVVILTAVDLLGFGPTVRKAYAAPDSESPGFFALFTVRDLLVILALENRSVTTVLFPAAIAVACAAVFAIIAYRRRALAA